MVNTEKTDSHKCYHVHAYRFFSGWLWKWRGLFIAIILSASIEFLQLITQRGLMEFDDVMHNCLGALIGIGFVMLIKKVLSLRAVRQ